MITFVGEAPQKIWIPIKPGATVYVGSIVTLDISALDEGCIVRGQADGAADTTNKDVPFGVVVGTNRKNPLYSSTYKAEYITDSGATAPHSSTVEFVGYEGPGAKGDRRELVEVALIMPHTILRAPIYNDAVGTAPTLLTATAGSTDGLSVTTNACDFTPVANLCTIYCRTGANRGIYRITDDTSTTAATWDVAMPYDIAVGDTFIRVPVRWWGPTYARLGDDTVCSYLNCSETPATNYDIIHVVRLDLKEAGKEVVEFYFGADHFATARA